ncbi:MAG: ferredoxin [Acidimicrobiales bacterium]
MPEDHSRRGNKRERQAHDHDENEGESWCLEINPLLCNGHGICVLMAPDLLALDPWGFPVQLSERLVIRELGAANRAIKACPQAALSLKKTTP